MSGFEHMKTINLFFCPKCNSKNVAAIFSVPVGKYGYLQAPRDRCLDCRYEELRGHFEIINQLEVRDKKIEDILDGIS